jgi:hypothetical protein
VAKKIKIVPVAKGFKVELVVNRIDIRYYQISKNCFNPQPRKAVAC